MLVFLGCDQAITLLLVNSWKSPSVHLALHLQAEFQMLLRALKVYLGHSSNVMMSHAREEINPANTLLLCQ